MRTSELLYQLQGVQTIQSVMSLLEVNRQKAVYYVHRLRKNGYVKTHKRSDNTSVYYISFEHKLKGVSYYDIINKYSPVKVAPPMVHNVYGKQPTIEETIVFAIKTKSLRTLLAALSLYRRITDWKMLYHLGKQNKIVRQIGALYDMSRLVLRKLRRMPASFRTYALPKKQQRFEYIIQDLCSSDFKKIENTWKVCLPFNKKDLEGYHDFS